MQKSVVPSYISFSMFRGTRFTVHSYSAFYMFGLGTCRHAGVTCWINFQNFLCFPSASNCYIQFLGAWKRETLAIFRTWHIGILVFSWNFWGLCFLHFMILWLLHEMGNDKSSKWPYRNFVWMHWSVFWLCWMFLSTLCSWSCRSGRWPSMWRMIDTIWHLSCKCSVCLAFYLFS